MQFEDLVKLPLSENKFIFTNKEKSTFFLSDFKIGSVQKLGRYLHSKKKLNLIFFSKVGLNRNLSLTKNGEFIIYKNRENCLASIQIQKSEEENPGGLAKITHFYHYKELGDLIQHEANVFDNEILLLSSGGLLKFCKSKKIFNLKTESKNLVDLIFN